MKHWTRRKAIGLLAAFVCSQIAYSQTLQEWDDVKITSINRLEARTLDIPLASAADAAKAYTPTNALDIMQHHGPSPSTHVTRH